MKEKKKHCHVKKGDLVQIICGENKGFLGYIEQINLKKFVVFLKNLVPRMKYVKTGAKSEAKKIELPVAIPVSNVMLYDLKIKKASRIGYKEIEQKKYRYFKKSGNLTSSSSEQIQEILEKPAKTEQKEKKEKNFIKKDLLLS